MLSVYNREKLLYDPDYCIRILAEDMYTDTDSLATQKHISIAKITLFGVLSQVFL